MVCIPRFADNDKSAVHGFLVMHKDSVLGVEAQSTSRLYKVQGCLLSLAALYFDVAA